MGEPSNKDISSESSEEDVVLDFKRLSVRRAGDLQDGRHIEARSGQAEVLSTNPRDNKDRGTCNEELAENDAIVSEDLEQHSSHDTKIKHKANDKVLNKDIAMEATLKVSSLCGIEGIWIILY